MNNLCSKYAINRDRTTLVPPLNAGTLPVSQLLQAATLGIFKVNRYLYARWNVLEIVGVGGPTQQFCNLALAASPSHCLSHQAGPRPGGRHG